MLRPRTSSLQGKSTLSEWGTLSSLSQKSRHQTIEGETVTGVLKQHTVQWTFVVPGAQNFVKMLKASNYTYSAWCTELCKSARGTFGLMFHHDWHWIPQVRSFFSAILFYCTAPPTPNQSWGITFLCTLLFSVSNFSSLILSISNYAVIFLSSNCRIKIPLVSFW